MWTNTNSYRENEAMSDIFTWNILRHIVLCLHILWLIAVNEIAARQTRTSFVKWCHKSVYHRIFNCGNRISVANFQVLNRSQNYRVTLGLLSSLWNIYHNTTAYFFGPPCMLRRRAVRCWLWLNVSVCDVCVCVFIKQYHRRPHRVATTISDGRVAAET